MSSVMDTNEGGERREDSGVAGGVVTVTVEVSSGKLSKHLHLSALNTALRLQILPFTQAVLFSLYALHCFKFRILK